MLKKRMGRLCSHTGTTVKEQRWSWNSQGLLFSWTRPTPLYHSPSHWRQNLNERLRVFSFKNFKWFQSYKKLQISTNVPHRIALCSPHSVSELASQPQIRSEAVLVTDWKTLFQCCCSSSDVFLDRGSTRTLPGTELPTLHCFRLAWSSVLLPEAWYCLAWPRASSLIFSGTVLLPRTPHTCYSSGAFLWEKVSHGWMPSTVRVTPPFVITIISPGLSFPHQPHSLKH